MGGLHIFRIQQRTAEAAATSLHQCEIFAISESLKFQPYPLNLFGHKDKEARFNHPLIVGGLHIFEDSAENC